MEFPPWGDVGSQCKVVRHKGYEFEIVRILSPDHTCSV